MVSAHSDITGMPSFRGKTIERNRTGMLMLKMLILTLESFLLAVLSVQSVTGRSKSMKML